MAIVQTTSSVVSVAFVLIAVVAVVTVVTVFSSLASSASTASTSNRGGREGFVAASGRADEKESMNDRGKDLVCHALQKDTLKFAPGCGIRLPDLRSGGLCIDGQCFSATDVKK